MDFYLKDESGNIIATFEYLTSTEDCKTCKAIIIKKGSYMQKDTYCVEKWKDCKWVEEGRAELIKFNTVEDFDELRYIFKEDMVYNSPTKAVSYVVGHNEKNAWNLLFNSDGESLMSVYRY